MADNALAAVSNRGPSRRALLGAGWLIAVVATAGSLNYQYGLGLFPCELCWYQRILMYPLVVVLGYATLTDQVDAHRLLLPLSIPGIAVSAYHSYLQTTPRLQCSFAGCGRVQFRLFGTLTIPNQALVAFSLLTVVGVVVWAQTR
jgi:disulfide bond formation protein DsbB